MRDRPHDPKLATPLAPWQGRGMGLVRCLAGVLGISLLCAACGEHPAPPVTAEAEDAGEPDPPPLTLETLGGTLHTPGNANVAWARTFPGEQASPPEIMRGPGAELIVTATALRRPKPTSRLVDDFLLMRFDADSGALL